jgi:predicted acetyltransferase
VTDIRFIRGDEILAFREAVAFGFGDDVSDLEGAEERFNAVFPLETCIAAYEGDRMVATFGSLDFDVTVPGGTVAMAGTTVVTVQPTHRRRGVLTSMMRMHLEQAIERGQPVAGLWASEPMIYGRFGYGLAAHSHDLTIPAGSVSLPPGPASTTIGFISHDDAPEILPPLYEKVRLATPGMLSRSDGWWKWRRLYDPESWREGASSRRLVVARRHGEPVGYAAYRQKEKWDDELPRGSIEVIEVIAVDDDARRSLWHYLTNIDLFPNVHWWNAPVDNPLYVEVDNLRQLTVRHRDTLYVRILDVPTAMEARRYEADGSLTIGVTDGFLGRGGTLRIDVVDGMATCSPTNEAPDVTMDVSDLGSLYLGRASALPRWRAGRIDGDEMAVRTLDRLLRTAAAPFCSEVF